MHESSRLTLRMPQAAANGAKHYRASFGESDDFQKKILLEHRSPAKTDPASARTSPATLRDPQHFRTPRAYALTFTVVTRHLEKNPTYSYS